MRHVTESHLLLSRVFAMPEPATRPTLPLAFHPRFDLTPVGCKPLSGHYLSDVDAREADLLMDFIPQPPAPPAVDPRFGPPPPDGHPSPATSPSAYDYVQQDLQFTDEEPVAFPYNVPDWVATGQAFVEGSYDEAVHRLHALSPSMVLLLGMHLLRELGDEVLQEVEAQIMQAAAREVLIRGK